MKKRTLQCRGSGLCTIVSAFFLGMMAFSSLSYGQQVKNFATVAVSHSTGSGSSNNVPAFAQASDTSVATYAELAASRSLVFASSSYVEIGFSQNVPAGSTVYIPIQESGTNGIVNTLAGGTLGDVLTDLLGKAAFEVNITDSLGGAVASYLSNVNTRNFTQGRFNIVIAANGQQYITFRGNGNTTFRNIRVTARVNGVISVGTYNYNLRVQGAYYLSGAADPCNPFVTTSFDATGVTLALLDNNGYPVKNPERAIDSDTTNFSTFGYGLATVAVGTVFSQDIHFSNLSQPGDQVKLKLRFPSSLLSANVLNTISIRAYRNDTLLSVSNINSLISAQVLALLTVNINNNLPATIQVKVDTTAAQTARFDRIRISYTQLVNGSLNEFIELYGAERVPVAPVVSVPSASSCPGTAMRLTISNVKAGLNYKWYNSVNAVVSTDTFYNITVPANGIAAGYYVTSSNCPGKESIGTPVTVTGTTSNCVSVSPIAYLQATFNGTRNKDVTPEWAAILAANATTQPYNTPAFQYTGTETVAPSIFTSTAAVTDIVDWMLLELKDSLGNAVDRKAVFVLENGNLANLDKSQPVVMKANAGYYYLTIRHRNHLGLSSNLNLYVGGTNLFDFTTASDATLYGDANAFTTLNGTTVMRAGNANSNASTRFNGSANDRDAILFYLGGNEGSTIFNVYRPEDVNMDGNVRFNGSANDRDALLFNLTGLEGLTIFQQIK